MLSNFVVQLFCDTWIKVQGIEHWFNVQDASTVWLMAVPLAKNIINVILMKYRHTSQSSGNISVPHRHQKNCQNYFQNRPASKLYNFILAFSLIFICLGHVLYKSSVFVSYFAEMVELKKKFDNFLGADGEHLRILVSSIAIK